MCKRIYLSIIVLLSVSLLLPACSDDDNDGHNAPTAVEKAFWQKYPDAKEVNWERKGIYERVEFKNEGHACEAWYQNLGTWIYTEVRLGESEMPAAVISTFKGGMYGNWSVDEYSRLDRNKLSTFYLIEAESGDADVTLYYKEDGTLVKTVLDQQGAVTLPSAILSQIQKQYPNAVILDIDKLSETRYVVEILDGGFVKEMSFVNNAWTETRWEVAASALPSAVTDALNAPAYEGYVIDDVYSVVYPDGTAFYSVELEKEDSLDMVVNIRANGEIILN